MNKGGRPKSARAATAQIVRIKLRLYPGEDGDLIAFFEGIPTGLRATSVKLALRSGVQSVEDQNREQDETILDALDAFIL